MRYELLFLLAYCKSWGFLDFSISRFFFSSLGLSSSGDVLLDFSLDHAFGLFPGKYLLCNLGMVVNRVEPGINDVEGGRNGL